MAFGKSTGIEPESSGVEDIRVRAVTAEDGASLLEVYRPYIEKTAVSFEYEVPSLEEFQNRIQQITENFPYLAAERNGVLAGYAYASRFHTRAAYSHCAEVSIYIREADTGSGIGRLLYQKLEECLKRQGILNLYACIATAEQEDCYLNHRSVYFHERMGYRTVGRFHHCGYKFERFYDMIWMEKLLKNDRF